nr:hypothetical protein [Tanacetum cinerariifolium]
MVEVRSVPASFIHPLHSQFRSRKGTRVFSFRSLSHLDVFCYLNLKRYTSLSNDVIYTELSPNNIASRYKDVFEIAEQAKRGDEVASAAKQKLMLLDSTAERRLMLLSQVKTVNDKCCC